jgi:hypothetical protein
MGDDQGLPKRNMVEAGDDDNVVNSVVAQRLANVSVDRLLETTDLNPASG